MILTSIDVESLYRLIPHTKGLGAVEYYLKKRGTQYDRHNDFVTDLLNFILTHKYSISY